MRKRMIERSAFIAPDGYRTRKEALEFLGVSNMTIYHYELRGIIHPLRIGNYSVYANSELEEVKKQIEV